MALGGEDHRDQRKILIGGKHADGTVFHALLMNIAMLGSTGPQTATAALEVEIAEVDVKDVGNGRQYQEDAEFKRESPAWPEDEWHFQ
jgi:hypothetical protein